MDANKEVKQALIHIRKLQTWLNKNSTTVTINKKFTWPKEAKTFNLKAKSLYSYLDILNALYKYIDENELSDSETMTVKLDKKLQDILKTNRNTINLYEISNLLK